ncbi:MAG: diaminopimelate decarboxylase [Oscillospiraceae bacterium]|jgi:diaminopimelate decarboxylase|nr:diaminopimelate decarboxylase [Oscillospiraceae bacterium]
MFVSDCLGVNGAGRLTIGGLDAVELGSRYATPLYVMDEDEIRANCRAFLRGMKIHREGRGAVAYASKAFCCKRMCRIAAEEGLWLDVASGGELHTALEAGFPSGRIIFHGNNKTAADLTLALEAEVGRIVVDNIFELGLLDHLAKAAGKTACIQLRIKPGVEAHTHEYIRTGGVDSKFGFSLESGEAMKAVVKALGRQSLCLKGLHCHIGSQIFGTEAFRAAASVMTELFARVKRETGYAIPELNLGGGFGIRYLPEQEPAGYESCIEAISRAIAESCRALNISEPFLMVEPGRSIVGPAGITLYTIGAVKEIPGVRTYLTVDGGMADNPRYALYKSEYHMLLAARALAPPTGAYTVAGRCCESGDLLGVNIALPRPAVGEMLAVLATGAYNYSMASNYNRLPRPAVVMVGGGGSYLAVRRESFEDVARFDV